MPTQDEIVNKYAALARAEIEREEAKSAHEKALENATTKQSNYAAEYVQLAKNASQHTPRLKELEAFMKQEGEVISKAESALSLEARAEAEARAEQAHAEHIAKVSAEIRSSPSTDTITHVNVTGPVQVSQR
jgi:septal ring factor EnvC (AmiA/AmiB activator)